MNSNFEFLLNRVVLSGFVGCSGKGVEGNQIRHLTEPGCPLDGRGVPLDGRAVRWTVGVSAGR